MASIEISVPQGTETSLAARFCAVRAASLWLIEPLSPEDQMVQSCPEASPVKWHLAHTTWFFETFVLREFVAGYQPFDKDFPWLFNSYYKSLGPHPEKRLRASFSRPSLEQVLAYRRCVEQSVLALLATDPRREALDRIELGLHHEQQHQELILTDIKHAFWTNPLQPRYVDGSIETSAATDGAAPLEWLAYPGGMAKQGNSGEGFAFDNEFPRHSVLLQPYRLAARLITCAGFLEFIEDGGYQRPELWLSDGWDTVTSSGWNAPLYWHLDGDRRWNIYTLMGNVTMSAMLSTPVCHISYYEADAFARWAGCRLPTEFEWEHAAATRPAHANLLESETWHPQSASHEDALGSAAAHAPMQMFGDVWEWTQSAYAGYPGYRPTGGALGEYNGKFMCNQFVLRGGSVATPQSHIRATYRNFFTPATRWQFSGIRLAKDGDSA